MKINEKYGQLASDASIKRTMDSLTHNGIHSYVVGNKRDALDKVRELVPKFSEIMTMTSVTLAQTEIDKLVNESKEFVSVRNELMKDDLDVMTKQRLGAAHEWTIGSVHAVTEGGQLMIASVTGSQLGSYAYGATNVIWVVGTQKIVKDLDDAMKRIDEYTFPLEDERALKAYGMHSGVNKVLLVNKEIVPGRIHIIFVKEKLGF